MDRAQRHRRGGNRELKEVRITNDCGISEEKGHCEAG